MAFKRIIKHTNEGKPHKRNNYLSSSRSCHLESAMQEEQEQEAKPSIWIRLVESGLNAEVLFFLPLAALGVSLGLLLGFRHWAPLGVLAFGTPAAFWVAVYRLADQDYQALDQVTPWE